MDQYSAKLNQLNPPAHPTLRQIQMCAEDLSTGVKAALQLIEATQSAWCAIDKTVLDEASRAQLKQLYKGATEREWAYYPKLYVLLLRNFTDLKALSRVQPGNFGNTSDFGIFRREFAEATYWARSAFAVLQTILVRGRQQRRNGLLCPLFFPYSPWPHAHIVSALTADSSLEEQFEISIHWVRSIPDFPRPNSEYRSFYSDPDTGTEPDVHVNDIAIDVCGAVAFPGVKHAILEERLYPHIAHFESELLTLGWKVEERIVHAGGGDASADVHVYEMPPMRARFLW